MIVNSEKHLFQWDIQQKMITHGVEYIDYIIDTEVVRIRCQEGTCIIPDEILQKAGIFVCWACSDTGTYTEYTFPVKERPMPPDYVFTPTQRETFDQLVERVDLAAYEAMRQAEQARQAADTANTAASNADTVAAIIRQMAIEGEFDGFSPEVKLEPVEGGTLLTITDRQGAHSAFIKDGSSAEITKQVIIEALGYTPADEGNTYSKAEVDQKEADTLASSKTYTNEQVADVRQEMSDKMGFYPVSLEGSPLQFIHHEKDGTDTVLGFTELADKYNDPKWFLYCEYAAVTFIPSLPPVEDPVHPDRVLEFSAAWYYSGSHWLTSIKINEGNQIKIEEHQIPTRDEMNAGLADKVGFSNYASDGVSGVVKTYAAYGTRTTQAGYLASNTRTAQQYSSATEALIIGKGTLENIKETIVKSVGDSVYQPKEKEWELIETIKCSGGETHIERNAEPDGTPYDFREMVVKAKASRASGSTSTYFSIFASSVSFYNTDYYRQVGLGLPTLTDTLRYMVFVAECNKGRYFGWHTAQTSDGAWNGSLQATSWNRNFNKLASLKRLDIVVGTLGFSADTEFEIYAVRV